MPSDPDPDSAFPPPHAQFDLLGHAGTEQTLLDAVMADRLPHGLILAGPPGIGKATLAYRLARFLLAGEAAGGLFGAPERLEIDPEHRAAHLIAAEAHPDLVTVARPVDPKTGKVKADIPVDAARKVGEFMRLTPAEGGWRIAIIDGADSMNRNAQNAILKVLEEPPERAVLVLVTNRPGRLLPTIRSRARTLTLAPLDDETMATLLSRAGLKKDAAVLLALSEGSIGTALRLAEQGGIHALAGLLDLLDSWPVAPHDRIHALADQLAPAARNADYVQFVQLLEWLLGHLVRAGARETATSDPVLGALARKLFLARGLDHWFAVWEKTAAIFERAERANLDRKQAILGAFAAIYG